MSFHPRYGYWGTPNFHKKIFFTEYSKEIDILHDSYGNRTDTNSLYESGSKNTILFLGGSHTWGAGVENCQTYSALIQQQSDYNCLNFGQCSIGLDQMVIVLLDYIKKIRPRVVLIELHPWVIHRILRKSAIGFPKPYFQILDNKITLKKIPKSSHIKLLRKLISEYYVFEKKINEYSADIDLNKITVNKAFDPLFMLWNQNFYIDMYKLMAFLFQTAKNICDENGVKLQFILGPTQQELEFVPEIINLVNPKIPRIRIMEMLDWEKIPFLDLQPVFEETNKKHNSKMYSDGHINIEGHKLFANFILEKIL